MLSHVKLIIAVGVKRIKKMLKKVKKGYPVRGAVEVSDVVEVRGYKCGDWG